MTKCQNYKTVTFLSTAYKVTYIIRKKLEDLYEKVMGKYRCGFRKGKATTNKLFTLRLTLEKLWEFNIPSYHLFIDFKTAYDSIVRKEIWTTLKKLRVPEEFVQVCK